MKPEYVPYFKDLLGVANGKPESEIDFEKRKLYHLSINRLKEELNDAEAIEDYKYCQLIIEIANKRKLTIK